jgi:hypothetical protein
VQRRHHVQSAWTPVATRRVERTRIEPLLVHGDGTSASTEPRAQLQDAGIGKLFDEHIVTRIGPRKQTHQDRVLPSCGHGDLIRRAMQSEALEPVGAGGTRSHGTYPPLILEHRGRAASRGAGRQLIRESVDVFHR